jgi:hypothetical protein
MLDELAAIRVALEAIGQAVRLWAGSQGQARCPVDDHIPDVIERLAKTQVGCRNSASGAE